MLNCKSINESGFTLLELLLSVLITSIITGMIFVSYSSVIETSDQNTIKAEEYQSARLALKMITDELDSTYFEMGTKEVESLYAFIGENNDAGYPSDKLTFTAKVSTWFEKDSKVDDTIEVEYSIGPAEDSDSRSLFRKFDSTVDGKIDSDPIEFVEGIYGFDIIYFTDTGEELEEWDSNKRSKDEKQLPKYVKITLLFGDEADGLRKYTTSATINIDL